MRGGGGVNGNGNPLKMTAASFTIPSAAVEQKLMMLK
jgi:hypothetical protein